MMTREQFIAIQEALSYGQSEMAHACGVNPRTVAYIRAGRDVSPRVAKRAKAALNDKIIELQRLTLFIN